MDPKDEIKQKIEISELIGEYLQFKPAGSNSFKAVCPFHSEKTPSFQVSSEKQIWHCFGCGEGGDCLSFVMKMEGMDFPEALLHLGKKVGVEVKRFSSVEGNLKQRLLELNDLAAKFFRKVLLDSTKATNVRDYVLSREIPENISEKFRLGFALDDWNALTVFLLKKGYSETEIIQAGLGLKKKSGSGIVDRFRNRMMIPLFDHHGNVVGFTGRVLPGSDKDGPKYMNSPETPIYHKGSLLYGLNFAKRGVKDNKCVVVVEGNLDVIASHKIGVDNVVASSGTALTEDQIKLLSRYTNTIVFAFDQDVAGFNAAKRGISIARSLDFDVRAAILPDLFNDPDDLIKNSPDIWKEITTNSVPIMEYLINSVVKGKDVTNIDDKRLIAKELLPAISDMNNVVEREHWLQKVSGLLGVETSILRTSITNTHKKINKEKKLNKKVAQINVVNKGTKQEQAAFLLIGSLVSKQELFTSVFDLILVDYLPSDNTKKLYNYCVNEYHQSSQTVQKSFFKRLRSTLESEKQEDLLSLLDKSSLLAEEAFQNLSQTKVLEQLNRLIVLLRASFLKDQKKKFAIKIRQAESAGDQSAVHELIKQLKELN